MLMLGEVLPLGIGGFGGKGRLDGFIEGDGVSGKVAFALA